MESYCRNIHVEISTPKIRIVNSGDHAPLPFICNGQRVEHVQSFLGLHFYQSGSVHTCVHCHVAQLQCADTVIALVSNNSPSVCCSQLCKSAFAAHAARVESD